MKKLILLAILLSNSCFANTVYISEEKAINDFNSANDSVKKMQSGVIGLCSKLLITDNLDTSNKDLVLVVKNQVDKCERLIEMYTDEIKRESEIKGILNNALHNYVAIEKSN